MSMDIILNQVALWRSCGATELNKRFSPVGEKYREVDNPIYKISDKPLIRYAKDYEKDKIKFCLFIRTMNEDDKNIEKLLDKTAKSIKKEDLLEALAINMDMELTYLDVFYQKGAK